MRPGSQCAASSWRGVIRLRCLLVSAVLVLSTGCEAPHSPLLNPETASEASNISLLNLPKLSEGVPVSPEQAPPQEVRPPIPKGPPPNRINLSLAEVRKETLENNLDLRVQLVQPAIAQEVVHEEEAKFDKVFYVNATLDKQSPASIPPLKTPTIASGTAEFGINVPLTTGGAVTVSLPMSGTQYGNLPTNKKNLFDSSLKFSLSQPLLRGAGVQVNTAPIVIAKLQSRQQSAQTKVAVIGVLADAETAYWNFYIAERTARVRYEQYERALKQEHQAQQLFKQGVVPEVEVVRARAGVASRVQAVIAAEGQRRQAQRNLKRIMNIPSVGMNSPTTLFATTKPRPRRLVLSPERVAKLAVKNRAELLTAGLQLAIDALTQEVKQNGTLPQLGFNFSFARLGADTNVMRSLDNTLHWQQNDYSFGLQLQVPLDNGAARAQLRQAMLQRVLDLNSRQQQTLLIKQQVYDAIDQLNTAWHEILAARELVLLAGRAYEGERKLFLAGVRTSTDVLTAEASLGDAQVSEVQALGGYEIAKIDVARATGTLLGQGRVELLPYNLDAGRQGVARQMGDLEKPPGPVRSSGVSPPAGPATSLNVQGAVVAARSLSSIAADLSAERASPAIPESPTVAPGAAIATNTAQSATAPARAAVTAAAAGTVTPPPPKATAPAPGDWIAAQNPASYTVQLIGDISKAEARAYIHKHGLEGHAGYFAARVGGQMRYAVVYGVYDSASAASTAAAKLPPDLRVNHPWLRPIRDVMARRLASSGSTQ